MTFLPLLLLFQHVVLDGGAAQKNPHTTSADIALGQKLYQGRCAGCHGPEGDGGKGTNLATPVLARAQTDASLYRIIRFGIPDSEMPSHNMTPREIWQIAAFVRTLGARGSDLAGGDHARGEALVRGKGACLSCHVLNGQGGHSGPPLTGIATRRSPSYLRTKLADPTRDLGNFRQVRLVTREGKAITGIRMNEDTWSIQLRDGNGSLHSFWKDRLKDLTVEARTLMPSYKTTLSEQELNDIVAYLARTGERQ
jgi:putative heme-binding domain-containing protein